MTTKPPTSLRIPGATRVRVEKWAQERGMPKNAAYVQLIERGLKSVGPHPGLNERPLQRSPLRAPDVTDEELGVKLVATRARQRSSPPAEVKTVTVALHLPRAPFGSRLKGSKK